MVYINKQKVVVQFGEIDIRLLIILPNIGDVGGFNETSIKL